MTRRFRSFFLSPPPPSISWRSQEFHGIGPHCYVFRRSGRAVLHKSEMNYLASIESRACEFSMDGVSGNRMIYLQKFPRTTNLGGGENYACAYVLCQFLFLPDYNSDRRSDERLRNTELPITSVFALVLEE